uniref:Uncharacterized protein n=1 Tax=Caenorhabditis japonica TaxID=281687 RepID=A0A8R1ID33_CAEJA
MTNCKFSEKECPPKEGAAFIWTPQPKKECRYVFYKTLNGFQTGKYWLSDDQQIGLSFEASRKSQLDCGRKIVTTDQGFGVMKPSRSKRGADDAGKFPVMTNFVTSNQLASQLLALEEAVLKKKQTTGSGKILCPFAQLPTPCPRVYGPPLQITLL